MSVAKRTWASRRIDSRERCNQVRRNDAALVMAPFGPRVRVQHKNARKEGVGNRLDHRLGVAELQAHVGNALALEPGERSDDPVEKRLTANKPNLRVGLRLLHKMFARAKPDLEPHFCWRGGERMSRGQLLRRN